MSVEVKPIIDSEQLKADVAFSDNDITSAFMTQAALYVEYAQQCQQAEIQMDGFKQRLEITEAQVDQKIRDEAAENNKKLTEAMIGKQVVINKSVIRAKMRYNEAKAIHGMAKSSLEAIKQRKDMLIQCGADLREEHKGQLRMGGNADAAKQKILQGLGK